MTNSFSAAARHAGKSFGCSGARLYPVAGKQLAEKLVAAIKPVARKINTSKNSLQRNAQARGFWELEFIVIQCIYLFSVFLLVDI